MKTTASHIDSNEEKNSFIVHMFNAHNYCQFDSVHYSKYNVQCKKYDYIHRALPN